jgi:hypothetical protein
VLLLGLLASKPENADAVRAFMRRLVFLPSEPFKPRVPYRPTFFVVSRAASVNSIIRPEMSRLPQPTSSSRSGTIRLSTTLQFGTASAVPS